MSTKGKVILISSTIAALVLAGFIFFKFFFVFGEGVKAGELNQIVYKGWIWKTYEGRLIQTGFKGVKGSNGVQSNEFNFSVTDKSIAEKLMLCSGKNVELKYKEYNGILPWRGVQRYIVYDIVSISPADSVREIPVNVGE